MEITMAKKSNGPLQIDISPDQFTVTPTQAITIAGSQFAVPLRYAEGHVLNSSIQLDLIFDRKSN
jgi:hypothetical protein